MSNENAVRIDSMPMQLNAGPGNAQENPSYNENAITQVLAQEGCVGTTAINAIIEAGELGTVDVTITVGLNAEGRAMTEGKNVTALPHPPFPDN
jgi:hypothetical protein